MPQVHFGEVIAQLQGIVCKRTDQRREVEEAQWLFGTLLILFLILIDQQAPVPDHEVGIVREASKGLSIDEPFLIGRLEGFLHVPFSLTHC